MGQMAWLDTAGSDFKLLHLRENESGPWLPYTTSRLREPDLQIKGASKGWTTYQKLRKLGWELVPSDRARAIHPEVVEANHQSTSCL
jgi:hypothetical protein